MSANTEHITLKTVFPEAWIPNKDMWDRGLISWTETVIQFITEQGDALNATEVVDKKESLRFNFEFADVAKWFVVLLRDTTLEMYRADLKRKDGLVSDEKLKEFYTDIDDTVHKAHLDVSAAFDSVQKTVPVAMIKMQKWKHLQSPWATYRKQVDEVKEQIDHINKVHSILSEASKEYHVISDEICTKSQITTEKIDQYVVQAQRVKTQLDQVINKDQLSANDLSTALRSMKISDSRWEASIEESLLHHLNSLSRSVDVPVKTVDGSIILKSVILKDQSRVWIESEVMPELLDNIQLEQRAYDAISLAALNISNKVEILSSSELSESITAADINLNLDILIRELENILIQSKKYNEEVTDQIKKEFLLSSVLSDEENFLEVSFQSSVRKLTGSGFLPERFSRIWESSRNRLGDLLPGASVQKTRSTRDRLIEYLEERNVHVSNPYAGLFLNKVFLGESFMVGQQKELEVVQRAYANWLKGYRGAILVHGARHSGKSSLIDRVALRLEDIDIYRLHPEKDTNCNGRILPSTYDLEEVLAFISKNHIQRKAVLIMDDLSKWYSLKFDLARNSHQLTRFMGKNSHRFFYIVSTSNCLVEHLNSVHAFEESFSFDVCVDESSIEEIQKAILIRHGASHRFIYDAAASKELSNDDMKLVAKRIGQQAQGNMGESLRLWSVLTTANNDHAVTLDRDRKPLSFPNILTPKTTFILETIMTIRNCGEGLLRKLYGPEWVDNWLPVLQRLIGDGIVNRKSNGKLRVNRIVAFDLGRLMYHHSAFPFYRIKDGLND